MAPPLFPNVICCIHILLLCTITCALPLATVRTGTECWREWMQKERRYQRAKRLRMKQPCEDGGKSYDTNIPEWFCEDTRRLPPEMTGDGPKWACGMETFKKHPKVLLVSMGCWGEIDWERAVRGWLPQAEMHLIDPSGHDGGWDLPKTLEQLKPLNVTFHEFWIGSTHVPGHKFPVLSVVEAMKRLGHAGETIDILKVDIEGHEWKALPEPIASGALKFHHFNVEVHNMNCREHIPFFAALDKQDYRMFYKEPNHWGCGGSGCIEYSFVSKEHACAEFATAHNCPPCSQWLNGPRSDAKPDA
eukprot:EG_transcript_13018